VTQFHVCGACVRVESPTWTELQSVRLTSTTTVLSGLLSGGDTTLYTVPAAANGFHRHDVTPVMTSSPGDVTQPMTSSPAGVRRRAVDARGSWSDLAASAAFSAASLPAGATYRSPLDPGRGGNDLLVVVRATDDATATPLSARAPLMTTGCCDQLVALSSLGGGGGDAAAAAAAGGDGGLRAGSPAWPPTPPDSLSSFPAAEFAARRGSTLGPTATTGSPPPPPYWAQSTRGVAGTMGLQSPYAARGSSLGVAVTTGLGPLLTTKTGRPRLTHDDCTTWKYNLKKTSPDADEVRRHFCSWEGMRRASRDRTDYSVARQSTFCR